MHCVLPKIILSLFVQTRKFIYDDSSTHLFSAKVWGGGENVRILLPILWHLIFFWFRNLQFPLIRILDTCAFIKILPLRVYNYVLYWYTSNLILWYSTVTLFAYNLKLTGAFNLTKNCFVCNYCHFYTYM